MHEYVEIRKICTKYNLDAFAPPSSPRVWYVIIFLEDLG